MIKAAFWRRDWVLGLAVALAMLLLGGSDFIQSIERKAYDAGVRASDRTPNDRIAVIAIDDASIRSIGRWPWPRDVHAKFADIVASGKPKVIGSLVFFSEPQVDPGDRSEKGQGKPDQDERGREGEQAVGRRFAKELTEQFQPARADHLSQTDLASPPGRAGRR